MPAAAHAVQLIVSASTRAGTPLAAGPASDAILEWREFLRDEPELGPEEYDEAMRRWAEKVMVLFRHCFTVEQDAAITQATVKNLLEDITTQASTHEGETLVEDLTTEVRARLSENAPDGRNLPPFYFSGSESGPLAGKVVPNDLIEQAIAAGRIMLDRGEGFVQVYGAEVKVSLVPGEQMPESQPHPLPADGDDRLPANAKDGPGPIEKDQPTQGISTAGALTLFGFKSGSTLKTEHKRVAAEVLKSISAVSDGPLQYISSHFAELKGTIEYTHLMRNGAIAEQRLKDLASRKASRADVLADDTLELALSAIATTVYAHETGDAIGAAAIDALHGGDGMLLGVDSRARAAQFAKAHHKLAEYGRKHGGGGSGGGGPGGGGAGGGGGGRQRTGAACYFCNRRGHIQRDCYYYLNNLPPPQNNQKGKGDGKGPKGDGKGDGK